MELGCPVLYHSTVQSTVRHNTGRNLCHKVLVIDEMIEYARE